MVAYAKKELRTEDSKIRLPMVIATSRQRFDTVEVSARMIYVF